MSDIELALDGQTLDDGADLTAAVNRALRRRNIDPATIDLDKPVLDPRGNVWTSPEEAAQHFTENALRALAVHADGEFDFDRLPEINEHVANWVEGQKRDPQADPLLLLRGQVGCGKTSQLFCLLRALVLHHARAAQRYPWYFITHRNLAAAVQPGSGRDPDRLVSLLTSARGVVVLDDLGDYNTQDFGRGADVTSRIINHRAHHRLPTAMSTNSPFYRGEKAAEVERQTGVRVAVLADAIDDRAISRLKGGWVVTLPQIDYREAQGKRFGP